MIRAKVLYFSGEIPQGDPEGDQQDAAREVTPSLRVDLTDHVVELRKTSLGGAVERVLVLAFQLGSFIA